MVKRGHRPGEPERGFVTAPEYLLVYRDRPGRGTVCNTAYTGRDSFCHFLPDVGNARVQGGPFFFCSRIGDHRVAPPSGTPARLCHHRVFIVGSNRGDRDAKTFKKTLHLQFIKKLLHAFAGCSAERHREGEALGSRGCDCKIKGVPLAHVCYGIGEIGKILKPDPVPGIPRKVLITEMVDRTDLVTGKRSGLSHVARGKPGDEDPAFHNSSVCFPARDGTIWIFAPGNSRLNSVPS